MDQEFCWISINALILIGILNCSGSDTQNAEVFFRVVQPEMHERILVVDKDIRMSIFFMANMATILQQMQSHMKTVSKKARRGGDNKPRMEQFDFSVYHDKME